MREGNLIREEDYLLNVLTCQKCQQIAIPRTVEYDPKKNSFILKIKCPKKHQTVIEMEKNTLEERINEIFQYTLICSYCGSTNPELKELEHNISLTMRNKHEYVCFNKLCSNCNKKSTYELDIILYKTLYDFYFNFLKSQITPEIEQKYENVLNCPQCENSILFEKVETDKEFGVLSGKCSRNKKHKIKLKFPLIEQYSWLGLLIEPLNRCPKCGTYNLFIFNSDIIPPPIDRGWRIDRRTVAQICRNCNYKARILFQQGLYEIYRRLIREKEDFEKVFESEQLSCPKCGDEISILKTVQKAEKIFLISVCKNRHKKKIALSLFDKDQWIFPLSRKIKRCLSCWSDNIHLRMLKYKQEPGLMGQGFFKEFEIYIQCLNCDKKRVISVNSVISDDIIYYVSDL